MILGAGLLLLLGLGLLVAGVVTGVTALYWACVGVCLVAAVVLFLVRRQIAAVPAAGARPEEPTITPTTSRSGPADQPSAEQPPKEQASARRGTAVQEPEPEPSPEPDPERRAEPAMESEPEPEPEPVPDDVDEPPLEEVEVTDLLLILDLHDEVLVIDEHPRYHLSGCAHLAGWTTFPLPIDEARTDGFTPCGVCRPDRHLADRVRARRHANDS
ncbi:MAG: hypothetical protein ACXVX8_06115 [Blastococcus sp.]